MNLNSFWEDELKGTLTSCCCWFFWKELLDDAHLGDVSKWGDYLPPTLRILPRWWERERFGARIYLKSPTIIGSYSGATSSFLKQHILVMQVPQIRHHFLKVRWREFITLLKPIWVLKINKMPYGKLINQRQKNPCLFTNQTPEIVGVNLWRTKSMGKNSRNGSRFRFRRRLLRSKVPCWKFISTNGVCAFLEGLGSISIVGWSPIHWPCNCKQHRKW